MLVEEGTDDIGETLMMFHRADMEHDKVINVSLWNDTENNKT